MKSRCFFLVAFTCAAMAAGAASHAAPRWLRLSWTVADATDSSMTVAWNDGDPSGGTVEYRPPGGTPASISASALETGSGNLDVTYEATITGLLPSSTYEYRVQSGGSWSGWKTFTTAPPLGSCSPMRIVVGGDGRGGEAFWDPGFVSRHWENIAGYIRDEMPILMVETGDIVHDGGEDEQWVDWFGISEFLTSTVPFLAVIGNHDDGPGEGDQQWYNKIYAQPKGGAGLLDAAVDPDGDGVEDMWAAVMGNVLLVSLSTEGIDTSVQHSFLEDTINEWDWRVDWKMLLFHRPLWSSGVHGSNEDDMLDAANLIRIIDDYGVDFVVCGHDHDYERFHPSKGGYGGRPRIINPLPGDGGNSGVADGTIHLVSGGAGSFTNFVMSCREEGCFVANGHLNYMVFDFLGDRVDVVVRDLGPILTLSEATMQPDPIDVFTVYKESSVCDVLPDDVPEESGVPEPVDAPDVPDIADIVPDSAPDAFTDTSIPDSPDAAGDAGSDAAPGDPGDADTDGGAKVPKGCGCGIMIH